jgi:hypothetical protein
MRKLVALTWIVGLTVFVIAQQHTAPPATANPASANSSSDSKPSTIPEAPMGSGAQVDPKLKDIFQAKIQAEWQAIKNKDKKAYAELLADDYQGVEVDGKGERTKSQALNELGAGNIFNYTLWGFKVIPLAPDSALVIYESTMQFTPTSAVRYSRIYISEIWVKRDGQWKELHYQETHVK